MEKQKLARILKELRAGLVRILGDDLVEIYLYGSRARGDERFDSDVDILVVLRDDFDYDEMLNLTLDLVAHISLENDVVISRAFVTRESFENQTTPFMMNIHQEAIPA